VRNGGDDDAVLQTKLDGKLKEEGEGGVRKREEEMPEERKKTKGL
jgi:hypothetical protein